MSKKTETNHSLISGRDESDTGVLVVDMDAVVPVMPDTVQGASGGNLNENRAITGNGAVDSMSLAMKCLSVTQTPSELHFIKAGLDPHMALQKASGTKKSSYMDSLDVLRAEYEKTKEPMVPVVESGDDLEPAKGQGNLQVMRGRKDQALSSSLLQKRSRGSAVVNHRDVANEPMSGRVRTIAVGGEDILFAPQGSVDTNVKSGYSAFRDRPPRHGAVGVDVTTSERSESDQDTNGQKRPRATIPSLNPRAKSFRSKKAGEGMGYESDEDEEALMSVRRRCRPSTRESSVEELNLAMQQTTLFGSPGMQTSTSLYITTPVTNPLGAGSVASFTDTDPIVTGWSGAKRPDTFVLDMAHTPMIGQSTGGMLSASLVRQTTDEYQMSSMAVKLVTDLTTRPVMRGFADAENTRRRRIGFPEGLNDSVLGASLESTGAAVDNAADLTTGPVVRSFTDNENLRRGALPPLVTDEAGGGIVRRELARRATSPERTSVTMTQ